MGACPRVLRDYRPFDAERGITEAPRDVPCIREEGHDGFHDGRDGMPFGPWRDRARSTATEAAS